MNNIHHYIFNAFAGTQNQKYFHMRITNDEIRISQLQLS